MKIDQIALYTDSPFIAQGLLGHLFGLTEWTPDIVVAHGTVFGEPVAQVAGELWFNYQAGIEVEVLRYFTNNHWHAKRAEERNYPSLVYPRIFVSHLGMHVDDMAVARVPFEKAGWHVAQELWTDSHTNPYLLERGRTYHYVVWDSRHIIGFDLKLIQRLEAGAKAKGEQK
jgi:hypothetical protein